MSSSATALQGAITSVLAADPALSRLLGGARRIFDDVPPGAQLPYVLFGPVTSRDWSTSTETGAEHTLTLQVVAHAQARRAAQDIADRVRALLHDQPLALARHRLVNLRHTGSEIRRGKDGRAVRAAITFRAVTESL